MAKVYPRFFKTFFNSIKNKGQIAIGTASIKRALAKNVWISRKATFKVR